MALKLTAGSLKGRKLQSPPSALTRPATAKVRQSIFEILKPLEGLAVLDIFAGTGSVGLEALSRGASEAVFVEKSQAAFRVLLKNLQSLGFDQQAYLIKNRASLAIPLLHRKKRRFDLIFIDPPYDRGLVDDTLRVLHEFPLLKPGGKVVCEHSPREIPSYLNGLELISSRKYGQTIVSFFKEK